MWVLKQCEDVQYLLILSTLARIVVTVISWKSIGLCVSNN